MSGTFAINNQWESGGGSSFQARWNHAQKFNLTTNISLDLGYASNTQVINNNAVDPLLNTQQISSALRFTKQYRWGAINIGGNRRQDISNGAITQTLPQLDVTPKPIGLGANSTWTPSFSFSQNQVYNQPSGYLLFLTPAGTIDSVQLTTDSRTTSAQLGTPLRLGSFNWTNTVRYTDLNVSGRDSTFVQVPDSATGNPTDSLTVVRYFAGSFSSALDWDTGINLPFLLRGTWKIQPTIGVQNVTSGAFAIRNRNTGGDWVVQGKRAQLQPVHDADLLRLLQRRLHPGAEPDAAQHQSADQLVVRAGGDACPRPTPPRSRCRDRNWCSGASRRTCSPWR